MSDSTVSPITIVVTDDGPLEVNGPFQLMTENGEVIEVPAGEPVYLCRCGGSTDKPFCDGTHSQIGFEGARKAVAQADAASK